MNISLQEHCQNKQRYAGKIFGTLRYDHLPVVPHGCYLMKYNLAFIASIGSIVGASVVENPGNIQYLSILSFL